MNWALRGQKVERMVAAAAIDAATAAVRAWAAGKDPVIHALAHAIAGAEAMAHHRIRDRVKAHRRNATVAATWADALEKLVPKKPTTVPALPSGQDFGP